MRSSETTIDVLERVRAAGQSGAGAARDDAESLGGGEPDDRGDVLGRLGEHDGSGRWILGPLGVVVRVVVASRRVGEHLIGAEDARGAQRSTESAASGHRRA